MSQSVKTITSHAENDEKERKQKNRISKSAKEIENLKKV